MPSRDGGRVGNLCSHRQAFPLHSAMSSLLNSCFVKEPESVRPILLPAARPITKMVEMVSSASPPNVSVTRGTKSVPVERQAEKLEDSLRWTLACSAWPRVKEDFDTIDSCSGLITWTSRVAGRPPLQVGRRMSARRDRELGVTPGASLVGARAADWAAEKITSRMALWRVIRSPFPPHPTWWSLKGSAMQQHSGQG